uniref:Uncharacterized protein n=1 Tax=Trichuris muris TaxID=70415 RepID=A0A5S6QXV3_TRIMR
MGDRFSRHTVNRLYLPTNNGRYDLAAGVGASPPCGERDASPVYDDSSEMAKSKHRWTISSVTLPAATFADWSLGGRTPTVARSRDPDAAWPEIFVRPDPAANVTGFQNGQTHERG